MINLVVYSHCKIQLAIMILGYDVFSCFKMMWLEMFKEDISKLIM